MPRKFRPNLVNDLRAKDFPRDATAARLLVWLGLLLVGSGVAFSICQAADYKNIPFKSIPAPTNTVSDEKLRAAIR